MIPEFPKFKKLEFSDREEILKYTTKFVPYSDFNFTSIWSWNTSNRFKVSILNKNLIMQFSDYVSDEIFLTCIGRNQINKTVTQLLGLAERKGLLSTLKFITKEIAEKLDTSRFLVEEDRDNFDYIYSIKGLSELRGSSFADLRNQRKRMEHRYRGVRLDLLDVKDTQIRNQIRDLFYGWAMNKDSDLEAEKEYMALDRLLMLSRKKGINFATVGVFDADQLIAFGINEVLWNGYAISHFVKANVKYAGIYAFLMQAIAETLSTQGCEYLNYEQDLGLKKLRYAKMCFRPTEFLQKYTVTNKK